jgi:hypothetical protein
MALEDRSQYLALASLCQTVVGALLAYVENDEWPKLEESLRTIIEPLEIISARPALTSGNRSAFEGYEHRRTVAEVWDPAERQRVMESLRAIHDSGNVPENKNKARLLIRPMQRLANQALWNFEQPSEFLPRAVLQLCRVP